MQKIISLLRDESGTTAIEYALIASLISVIAVVAIQATGISVADMFQVVVDAFTPP